jgi:PiT family inorganic phosphate transporter
MQPADLGHWGAAAALSFARGVNDTPKIIAIGALAFAAVGASLGLAFAASAAAMAAGSYLAGRRVTRALGEGVVQMDKDGGLTSAIVAAGCVLAASFYTLPVSTTHVSTGAIVGAGLRQGHGAVDWRTVGSFALAWIVTLPVAAVFGGFATWALAVAS